MSKGFKVGNHYIPINYDKNRDSKLQVSELNIWCAENDMKYKDGEIKPAILYNKSNIPKKFNKEKYSLENIKKRYPQDRYEIKINSWGISVHDNWNNKKNVLNLKNRGIDGVYIALQDNDTAIEILYDKNSNYVCSTTRCQEFIEYNHKLTDKIHNEICYKNSLGLPGTGKNLEKYINLICAEKNFGMMPLLKDYENRYNTTLISDIFSEIGLPLETRINYVEKILNKLCDYYSNDKNAQHIKYKIKSIIHQESKKTGFINTKEIDKNINALLNFNINENSLVAQDLKNDLNEKTMCGFQTTGKNFDDNIKKITPENVRDVLMEYKSKNNDVSLIHDLLKENSINLATRIFYIKRIIKDYLTFAENKGVNVKDLKSKFDTEIMYQLNNKKNLNADYLDIFLRQLDDRVCAQPETNTYNYSLLVNDNKDISKPNCKIDQDFSQGNTGDCWLLASIKAIASRPKGLKILNESIKVDEFGNTVVTLKGVNKTYVISPEELNSNIAYAQGDGDIRALEIAVNNYIEEKRGINMRLDINGGYGNVAYLILIGDKNFVANNIGKFNNKNKIFENNLTDEFNYRNKTFDDNLIDEFNNKDKIFTVSSSKNIESITIDENGDTHILTRRHAYAVIRSDTKYVYLVNPWDSKIEFKITRELFKEFFNRIYMLDL